ncbi:hypothetical protein BJ170DRAFT_684357 [Xylariales sp. AK1849]|nr:hypothetical protein BJ170DRAFT_684357 [Xylariales sp. AK1849]
MQLFLIILWTLFQAWPVQAVKNATNISVGFDLKDSYGTAAISFPNGTSQRIALAYGNQAYRDTLHKLSLWSSQHEAPPYTTPEQRWKDWPRQKERNARKAAGLPASEDVGAISTLVRALKEETEKAVGFSITSAAASVPVFPAIYDEDLYDSFEYIGLEYLQMIQYSYRGPLLTYDPAAALTGHGFALCSNIEHPQECWERDDGFWHEYYYIVDYTKSSLLAYHTGTFSEGAYDIKVAQEYDLFLGSDARFDNLNEDHYWDQVRQVLLTPLLTRSYQMPTKVILVGESSDDPSFREHFDDVLEEFFKDGVPPIFDQDPVYVQAKGAAEFVRRSAYLPKPTKPQMVASTSDMDLSRNYKGQTSAQKVVVAGL